MLKVRFINVGYGESILITLDTATCADGQFVMLIDGGSAHADEYTGKSGRIRVLDYLNKCAIRHIDRLVISHIHEDHLCGLIPLLSEIPVNEYWMPLMLEPRYFGKCIEPDVPFSETNTKMLDAVNTFSLLMQDLPKPEIRWIYGIERDFIRVGDLCMDLLGPDESSREQAEAALNGIFRARSQTEINTALTRATEAMNNSSIILRLRYHGQAVLLGADTNAAGFSHVMKSAPDLLRSNVFKIGHHGQRDAVTPELIRLVKPDLAVCCASNDYRNRSSAEETFNLIRDTLGSSVRFAFADSAYCEEWGNSSNPRNAFIWEVE